MQFFILLFFVIDINNLCLFCVFFFILIQQCNQFMLLVISDHDIHRIIKQFMIQGGCPLGTGTGGPGYEFDDEIDPSLKFDKPYLLAMANAGLRRGMDGKVHGTNGSQFFITTVPTPWLDGHHTIFGEVADDDSKKVVDKLEALDTDPMDRPLEPAVILSVDVAE